MGPAAIIALVNRNIVLAKLSIRYKEAFGPRPDQAVDTLLREMGRRLPPATEPSGGS